MNIVRCDLSLITNCFEEMSMNNKNNNSWKDIIGEFSANSNVGLYLKRIRAFKIQKKTRNYTKRNIFLSFKVKKRKILLFLSVIIRTQGKREQGLREALCVCRRRNARTLKYY